MRKFMLSLVIMCSVLAIQAFAAPAPNIEIFSPQGGVKGVRQATARFSDQMVGFGDPRQEEPFTVRCSPSEIAGKGRWIDGRTWSYDFEKDLPAGISCEFTLKPGLKTLKGEPVGGQSKFSFQTGGPAVKSTLPYRGNRRIDENQIFVFSLDAEPDEASVGENVYCSVQGIAERVGIRIISGEEKKKLLGALKGRVGPGPSIALQCRRSFPPESEVKIIWGAGVRTRSGIPTEKDQEIAYQTRKPFAARFECMRERADSGCMPVTPMYLSFTADITGKDAAKITLKSSRGKTWKPDITERTSDSLSVVAFKGPFPEKTDFQVIIPKELKDDAGRHLDNQDKFPLAVRTDTYPVLAKFPSKFGIIEFDKQAVLPLTVRNIETAVKVWQKQIEPEKKNLKNTAKEKFPGGMVKAGEKPMVDSAESTTIQGMKAELNQMRLTKEELIIDRLKVLDWAERERPILGPALTKKSSKARELTIKPDHGQEFQVIGVPFKEPGFYIVELKSRLLGEKLLAPPAPMYVAAGALVTNMAVHFKWGRASSLVWVTSLDRGEPVKGAAITIHDCSGKRVWQGKTGASGIAKVDKALGEGKSCPRDWNKRRSRHHEYSPALSGIESGYFVFAKSGKDLSFTHSSWSEGIEPWRFQLPAAYGNRQDNLIVHTVFDRTLLRANEDIHMKHFVRKRTMRDFFIPADMDHLNEAVIEHQGSDQQYTLPVKWSANGTALSSWKIPEKAKLGTYSVYLRNKDSGAKRYHERAETGSFRVEEFRVPLMKAFIKGPREPAVNAEQINVDLSVSYLSGGGASLLPVKLRTGIRPRYVHFSDYEGFLFSNGAVKTGIFKGRYYGNEDGDEHESGSAGIPEPQHKTRELTLDKFGAARTTLSDFPRFDAPRNVAAELEFRDPNGEVQTVSSAIPYYPSGLLIGISAEDQSQDAFKYNIAVLDLNGRPAAGVKVKADIFERKAYSHRKRIHGGFYSYESATEVKKIGTHCEGVTTAKGILLCTGKAPLAGNVIIQAQARDSAGNAAFVNREVRLFGKHDQWFEPRNDDRMDLTPDRKKYQPGENIRFKLGMPFRSALALVTVEREGVMDAYVKKLSRKSPVIEIPVKNNYVPNVFVSALIVKGRIPKTKPTATFDPGKPAYKLGIAEVQVGWRPHELKVEVATDKKVYAVREKVRAGVKLQTADGMAPPKGSEVAVAVIDEGLLELKPNDSWNLLESMMRRKFYEVKTSTAQMMVTGKRHFGRKALAQGGGGGRQTTRELFDTLVYWNGAVPVDENGVAQIEFPLNDSLTSFRIAAVASGGKGLFGTGQASIRATKDLMILSGLPQLVRERDRFKAGFTIRNISQNDLECEVKLSLTSNEKTREFIPFRVAVKAGESTEAGWDIDVPVGAQRLIYNAAVADTAGKARDAVKITQKVAGLVPVRTFQATLEQLKGSFGMRVAIPHDAAPGRGGLNIALKPKIAQGLNGVEEYMRLYPYSCLEQKISIAVSLKDENAWKKIMADLPSYLDSAGLAKYFPVMEYGSDTLTSYLLAIGNEAGYEIPSRLQSRMIQGLKNFVEGRITRYSNLNRPDLTIRKLAAVEALSRYGEARAKLLASVTIDPNLWPTSAVLDWINILSRVNDIPEKGKRATEAERILRSRLNLQGTTLTFSTEAADDLWWLMISPDVNAVKGLLTTLKLEGWRGDNPRIVTALAARMKRGHWSTTVANAWGVLALDRFSEKYESTPVSGATTASINGKSASFKWADRPGGFNFMFGWPKKPDELKISHAGNGSPWITVQSMAAIELKTPLFHGFSIKKSVLPVEQKIKGQWSRGDILRVKLEINSQADASWVVVDDPIPAGAAVLGSGLGRGSRMLTKGESQRYYWEETFRERSFEAIRIYYEYMPKGSWTAEYTMRLNNDGLFNLPPSRVEALYSPEMFGELPNARMEVGR